MKKCYLLLFLSSVLICFLITSCEPVDPDITPTPSPTEKPTPTIVPTQEPTPVPTPTSVPTPTPTPSFNGDYGMTLIFIPGGTFQMGCSPDDDECEGIEYSRHEVTISPFFLSAYELTQQQWEDVMEENPSYNNGCPDCPVELVSRDDVDKFISKLNKATGKTYRLPTEAEWEYAVRAGTTTRFYCGTDVSCLDDIAWYRDNSDRQTHPVGEKQPNAWGLYDMTGNVSEWCQDYYDAEYYSKSPSKDPTGPEFAATFVIRGGDWNASYNYCRMSARFNYSPTSKYSTLGLRLVHD